MKEKTEQEIKANWSPLKTYNKVRTKPVNNEDYIGRGCSNIAFAIIYGLTYVGDCIKVRKNDQSKEKHQTR